MIQIVKEVKVFDFGFYNIIFSLFENITEKFDIHDI